MNDKSKPLCGEIIEKTLQLQCHDGKWEAKEGPFVVGEEVPVDLVFNEMSTYATMMLTPFQLEDFALGFCLSERIIKSPDELLSAHATFSERDGSRVCRLDVALKGAPFANLLKRSKRNIAGATACGICGGDGEELSKDLPVLPKSASEEKGKFALSAIVNACEQLRDKQTMNKDIRMLHAAAWADMEGDIVFVREDLGRHNALDKLIGVLKRMNKSMDKGFCLITSRCSFEMAQKSVLAGIECLVAVSSPTSYAVEIADKAGMTLIGRANPERQFVFTHQERIERDL